MRLTNRIVDLAIEYEVVDQEEKETYLVATELLLFSALTWGTLLLMGALCGQLTGCLIFLAFHLPVRIFAGGFHQKTRIRCYAQSCFIFLLLLFGAKTVLHTWIVENWSILILISFLIIWLLAPVETDNKPLTKEENKKYRFITRILLVLEMAIEVVFLHSQQYDMLYYSSISIFLAAFHLVTGVVFNNSSKDDVLAL